MSIRRVLLSWFAIITAPFLRHLNLVGAASGEARLRWSMPTTSARDLVGGEERKGYSIMLLKSRSS